MGIKGQKVNPIGWRVGVHRKWKQTWFQEKKEYSRFLINNINLQNLINSAFFYNQKNVVILNTRILGNVNNEYFFEMFFFKKRFRHKRKKKARLFLLNQIKKNLINQNVKLNLNNRKINFNNNFKVYSFLTSLNVLNNKSIIPKFYDSKLFILDNTFFNIMKNLNIISKLIMKIQEKYMSLLLNLLNKEFYFNNNLILFNILFNVSFNKKSTTLLKSYQKYNTIINQIKLLNQIYTLLFKEINFFYSKNIKLNLLTNIKKSNNLKLDELKNNWNKTVINNDLCLNSMNNQESINLWTKIINYKKTKKKQNNILYKNFVLRHKNYNNSLINIKKSLNILSGNSTQLILINSLSFMRFKNRIISSDLIQNIPSWQHFYQQKQWNLLKNHFIINSLEKSFKYRYPGIYPGNLLYIIYFSLFFKNPELIVKMLGLTIEELPKNARQIPFIRLLLRIIARLSGSFDEILGIRLQFKGRFDKWRRTKSILFESGESIPKQTFSIFLEYGSTKGFIKKGTYGIRLWIHYKPVFALTYKDIFEQYWLYSKFINKK